MRIELQRKLIGRVIGILISCAPLLLMAQKPEIDKARILIQARDKYYNLRKSGMADVRASMQPDWDELLAGTNGAASKPLLENLHFWISIDAEDKFQLHHDAKAVPVDKVDGVKQIFSGVNSSVTGFFRTWSIFLLTSPFPQPGSDYSLDKLANGYRFSQRQDQLDVAIDTDNDFAITEIKVVAADLKSSLKPDFEKTPAGFVLKGYSASSVKPDGNTTTVVASLDYQTVDGLRVLQKVDLDTVFQGSSTKFGWTFSDYAIKRR
jgi:hypothetical protein